MHALVLHCINQYTKFEVYSFTNYKDMTGAKFEEKISHVTLLRVVCLCHRMLRFDTVYLHAKFDDYSFSHSRDIIEGVKI